MIKLAEELGIEKINFHNLFKTGIPRDHFTGNIDISIDDWFEVKDEIEEKVENTKWNIDTVLINKILLQREGLKPNGDIIKDVS